MLSLRSVHKRLSGSEYHIGVVPASGSSRGDDDVLMRSSPVQDGLDGAPRVVHVSKVAPVVTRLTDGCVVGLQTQRVFFICPIISDVWSHLAADDH